MKTYIFYRGDFFYPINLKDNQDAIDNALCNPGTTSVTDIDGNIIWSLNLN